MALAAALIYWAIVIVWVGVLVVVVQAFFRAGDVVGTTRLLVIAVGIEAVHHLAANIYFGIFFDARDGLLSRHLADVLGRPEFLLLPKMLNVIAACIVLVLLVRWAQMVTQERLDVRRALVAQSDALERESEEQRLLFELSVDLIMIMDRDGVIRRVSESCKAILGYDPEDMVGCDGARFVDPASVTHVRQAVSELPDLGVMTSFTADLRHRQGNIVTVSFSSVWAKELDCALVMGHDVTEQNRAAKRLDHLAYFDQLSELPNRFSLVRDLDRALGSQGGLVPRVAIAVLDLDGFKDINDLLGHSIGDQVVQEIGARLEGFTTPSCRPYRSGGDEFFLLMPGCNDPTAAAENVMAVIRRLEERLDVGGYQLFVTVSAGVALAPQHGTNTEDLILAADLALHHAASGQVRLFESSMRARARARQEIEIELRQAVAEGEFVLYFQPQLRLRDRRVVGAEALLRWNHPKRGLLAPAAFIDALSRSPAAKEAGQFVLQSACMAAAQWRAKGLGALRVGVNLFPSQFRSRSLLSDVAEVLDASGISARQLELEITENIALGHDEEVLETLLGLRAKGVGIAFDDFGTGYASLSYLMRFPLTRLKIDRSFVQRITADSPSQDTAIVQSLLVMAHNIGLHVVAEGVETEAQAAFLKARRCEEVQGFLFAKPMPLEDFVAFALDCKGGPACCSNGAASQALQA